MCSLDLKRSNKVPVIWVFQVCHMEQNDRHLTQSEHWEWQESERSYVAAY